MASILSVFVYVSIKSRKRMLICILALCLPFIIYQSHYKREKWSPTQRPTKNKSVKSVLLFNYFFEQKYFGLLKGNESFRYCWYSNCEVIHREDVDKNTPYAEYDAVLFHGIDTDHYWGDNKFLNRSPHQRYIFLAMESPINTQIPDFFRTNNFFNWTASFRQSSDIYMPYGRMAIKGVKNVYDPSYKVFPVWREPIFDNMSIPLVVKSNRKLVAWFVSKWHNVLSRRNDYVSSLAQYVPVDVYGSGQKRQCRIDFDDCDKMIEKTYKFYLAFENSLCDDYITEKFYRALTNNVVPIVYGGADYKKFAPPLSYIDVRDFVNPEDLARYLIYLDQNQQAYEKYFWWKEFYTPHLVIDEILQCQICAMLNNPEKYPEKSYQNIESWWNPPNICHEAKDHFSKNHG